MQDTYFKAKDKKSLDELKAFFLNVLPVKKGAVAIEEATDKDGFITTGAQPAKGDPDMYYACVRLPSAYKELEVCTEEEGAAVCGIWAKE